MKRGTGPLRRRNPLDDREKVNLGDPPRGYFYWGWFVRGDGPAGGGRHRVLTNSSMGVHPQARAGNELNGN